MSQWGFYFDQSRCIGCKTCIIACQAWNEGRRGDAHLHKDLDWMGEERNQLPVDPVEGSDGNAMYPMLRQYMMKEQLRKVTNTEYGTWPDIDVLYHTVSCGHCENPACIAVCPVNKLYKEPERGLVVEREEISCIGCTLCQRACPYDAPQFYDDPRKYPAGEKPVMVKCDMCQSRLEEGLKPACVAACRVRALDAGPMEELRERYPDAVERTLDCPSDVNDKGIAVGPHHLYRAREIRKW